MHHTDDEEKREVEHLHTTLLTPELTQRENCVMEPDEKGE
tara:strand:+ start:462 stop:581 length:120 start_codon:yes stop_codon:yes gene_type:complete